MAMAGLYRRLLPCPPAVDFASSQGKQLFLESIQNGTMEGFYRLVSYFQTQSEPAFCGLASLSMVLNALAIDPGRKWKGPWRWFDESMLDCCEPLEKIKARGISFGKLVCLAHCAGAKVEAFHASHSSIDDFRKYVMKCSTSDDCHVISSYHRGALKQVHAYNKAAQGTWHALYSEIRRIEDAGSSLSVEEKARLAVKEEVLKQVQETRLFNHVASFLSNSCSRQIATSGDGDTLPVIAASVCCQGAEILGGKLSSPAGYCCQETCTKCWKAEDDKPITMVCGTVVNGNTEQRVDVLIPSSSGKLCCSCSSTSEYIRMHPASTDVLTVLLLSLPSTTWAGITDEQLLREIHGLVSTENLPTLLQEEVLHLRRQLHILKRCQEGKIDEDLGVPFS
ncbi:Phytochelatin synthase, N-terminal catalytic domain [Sesbania bispinosa]|nr:Phytochelatin synthase, N-terminal catalytic domain [Sesbania bispinosa]